MTELDIKKCEFRVLLYEALSLEGVHPLQVARLLDAAWFEVISEQYADGLDLRLVKQ